MGEIVSLDTVTSLDLDPDRVLEAAVGEFPEGVVVIGYDSDGEFNFCSSISDGPEALWLLELAKKRLLEMGDPE